MWVFSLSMFNHLLCEANPEKQNLTRASQALYTISMVLKLFVKNHSTFLKIEEPNKKFFKMWATPINIILEIKIKKVFF